MEEKPMNPTRTAEEIQEIIYTPPAPNQREERRRSNKARELKMSMAETFGEHIGMKLAPTRFSLRALSEGMVHGKEWENHKGTDYRYFDHAYFYRKTDKTAGAIAAHLYNVPADIEEKAAGAGLKVSFPDFPSWHYPGRTTLVMYQAASSTPREKKPYRFDSWTASKIVTISGRANTAVLPETNDITDKLLFVGDYHNTAARNFYYRYCKREDVVPVMALKKSTRWILEWDPIDYPEQIPITPEQIEDIVYSVIASEIKERPGAAKIFNQTMGVNFGYLRKLTEDQALNIGKLIAGLFYQASSKEDKR